MKKIEYKNVKVGKEMNNEISEQEVNSRINELMNDQRFFESKEDEAKLHDIAVINFEGFVGDLPFEGGKGEHYPLALGSNTFIPGFESQLVGHKKGEKVDVKVTFPEHYGVESLDGKEATFKCEILDVLVPPVFDDSFASKIGFKDVEELRSFLKEDMKKRKTEMNKGAYIDKLGKKLIEEAEVEASEEDINNQVEEMIRYYEEQIAQYGHTMEDYLKQTGSTLEAFKESLKEEATLVVKQRNLFLEIAQIEGIEASIEDVNRRIDAIAMNYQLSEDSKKAFKERFGSEIRHQVVLEKVADFLFENND